MLAKIDARNSELSLAFCHVIKDVEEISDNMKKFFVGDAVLITELDGSVWSADRSDIIDLSEDMVIKMVGTNIYKIRLECVE